MKRYFITSILFLLMTLTISGQQQQKPLIMVMPSEVWCQKNGFGVEYTDDDGQSRFNPDFSKAFRSNSDIRVLITKMGSIMSGHNFPLQDMEASLKNLQDADVELMALATGSEGGQMVESSIDFLRRETKVDITIDLDYKIEKKGPQNQVTFNIRALDAYSSKQIAGVVGVGTASTSAPVDLLLEESVLKYMGEFVKQIDSHFADTQKNGREIKVEFRKRDSWDHNFETDFLFNGRNAKYRDLVEALIRQNAQNGQFTVNARTENLLRYVNVRMPVSGGEDLFGNVIKNDAQTWMDPIIRMLEEHCQTEISVNYRGLGEIWIYFGK